MQRLSIQKAVTLGLLFVNAPLILLVPLPLYVLNTYPDRHFIFIGTSAFWFIASWLWWSVTIPKWRLWAYKRVGNIQALKDAAVKSLLIWPDNSIFSKTEIKSKQHAALEAEYERNGA